MSYISLLPVLVTALPVVVLGFFSIARCFETSIKEAIGQ
jgi:hypothetical protein